LAFLLWLQDDNNVFKKISSESYTGGDGVDLSCL